MSRLGDVDGILDGQVGLLAPTMRGWRANSGGIILNNAYFCRFVPSRLMAIVKMGFVLETNASAAFNYDLGIYSSNLTRLVSTGSVNSPALNVGAPKVIDQTVTSTVLTPALVYYAAFATDATAGNAMRLLIADIGNSELGVMFTSSYPETTFITSADATKFPLQASITNIAAAATGPVLSVRES